MSVVTFFARDYNLISGPEHDTYNLRPHAFRVRLQYQAPTMSVVTFFVRDYNIRPQTWHLQSFV